MMIKQITDIVTLILLVAPVVVQLFKLIGTKTHNQRLSNLSNRADTIVQALEQTDLASSDKKAKALDKLSSYASETKIKLTPDQASDFIEQSVRVMNSLNK